jgi:hypothetical protein
MSGVTSLSGGGGAALTGVIGITSNNGAITVGEDTTAPANNITLTYNPNGLTGFTVDGQAATGNVSLTTGSGLSYTNDGFGTVTLNTFSPSTGDVTAAATVAQNLAAAMAWDGSTATPPVSNVAYAPGAMVIYSGTTFVCLVAQPIGSALPVTGTNWQSIGGGTGGTPTKIANAGSSVAIDISGGILMTNATSTEDVVISTNTAPATGVLIRTDNDTITIGNVGGIAGDGVEISGAYGSASVGNLTIGGVVVPTGLYVSNTQLLYNNAPVGGAATGTMVAQNLGAAMAWQGSTAEPPISTVAYGIGAVVIFLATTFVCLVAQPIGSTFPVTGANWQSIAGGSSITAGGATVACDNPYASGSITLNTTTTGTAGDITLDTTFASGNSGVITLKGGGEVVLDTTIDTTGGLGVRIITGNTTSFFEDVNAAGQPGQISFETTSTNPAKLTIGGTSQSTGLYVSNTQLLYNNVPVGGTSVPTPMSVPRCLTDANGWGGSIAYPIGSVVYSPTPPYNWFICYVATTTADTTDPQADVNAGTYGQGANWQLLAPAGFTTTTGTTPGTYYGSLTLSGSSIASTDLATGEVVIQAPIASNIANGGGNVEIDATGNVSIYTPLGNTNISGNNVEISSNGTAGTLTLTANKTTITAETPTSGSYPNFPQLTTTLQSGTSGNFCQQTIVPYNIDIATDDILPGLTVTNQQVLFKSCLTSQLLFSVNPTSTDPATYPGFLVTATGVWFNGTKIAGT